MEVVLNKCYGGFSLSQEACRKLISLGMNFYKKGEKADYNHPYVAEDNGKYLYYCDGKDIGKSRTNPLLIKVIKEMGKKAWGQCAKLEIVNLDVNLEIDSFDGMESVKVHFCGGS